MTATEREAYSRGRTHYDKGDVEPALEAFSALLATRGEFADVHYMVGMLFERRGDADAAMSSLRAALRINPSYTEALLALASIHERHGDYDRSRELSERAAQVSRNVDGGLDPTTRGKLANLQAAVADAYFEVGELREAVEAYRKALDRCPEFLDIRYRLGIALREAGLPHKSEQELKRVIRGNPRFLDASVQLGLTYYTLGRSADAIAQWEQVVRRDPAREEARMYIRMVEQGQDPTD